MHRARAASDRRPLLALGLGLAGFAASLLIALYVR